MNTEVPTYDIVPILKIETVVTVRGILVAYRSDPISPYHKARYYTRKHYDSLLRRIDADLGHLPLSDIKARTALAWHAAVSAGGKVAMGHAAMTMLRIVVNFGAVYLEIPECVRLSIVLRGLRIQNSKPRGVALNAKQATDIRGAARAAGLYSIALAQAIQFEGILRQKDVIGEWVPITEPEPSDIFDGDRKWLRGIRWTEIDDTLVLRHITSKRQKEVAIDLKLAPMVLEELQMQFDEDPRCDGGPIVRCEETGLPWRANEFRREWRQIATSVDIPPNVFNMDTRAGAISEATDAGADIEHVRHAATHSDIAQTQKYSRNAEIKTANVQRARAAYRGVT